VVIDYTKEMVVLVVVQKEDKEEVYGMGQYFIDENSNTAEVAFVVRDDHQNQGIGAELLTYLTYLAKRKGLHGFTATVLMDNKPMLMLFEKAGFVIDQMPESGTYELKLSFR
jgi:RimJ/RimL family protein N-acetyltransferase